MDAWPYRRRKGNGVTICNVEYAWNFGHADLPRGIRLLGGTPLTGNDYVNHGTAVLGEMVSLPNAFGTVGISHAAKIVVHGTMFQEVPNYNVARAIDNAAAALSPGDVMLIEQQAAAADGGLDYVAVQYWSNAFTASRRRQQGNRRRGGGRKRQPELRRSQVQ